MSEPVVQRQADPQESEAACAYVRIDGTTWPRPEDPQDVEWQLRYGAPTRADLLIAASYIRAYRALCSMPQRARNGRISALKRQGAS